MSTLYDTSFGPGIPLGSSLVPGSTTQGALNANLLTGGFSTVPALADRDAIPVDLAEGLKLDGLSSGRRQVGMVVTVAETGERYELKIVGFESLSAADKLSSLADNTNWVVFTSGSGDDSNYAKLNQPNVFTASNTVSDGAGSSVETYPGVIFVNSNGGGMTMQSSTISFTTGGSFCANIDASGTQSGQDSTLVFDANHVKVAHNPIDAYDVATKAYVDAQVNGSNVNQGLPATVDANDPSEYHVSVATDFQNTVDVPYPAGDDNNAVNVIFLNDKLNTVVHNYGAEGIYGQKSFGNTLQLYPAEPTALDVVVNNFQGGTPVVNVYAPGANDNIFLAIGKGLQGSALFGYSELGGINHAFFTTYGRPETDFTVGSNGNIGIGTSSASQKLTIVDGISTIRIGSGSGGATPCVSVLNTNPGGKAAALLAGGAGAGFGFSDDGYFAVFTESRGNFTTNQVGSGQGVVRLMVLPGGNVGVGTSSPSEKLEVDGNVKAAKFIGDGSLLTNIPAAGARIANAAVFTATTSGAQTIAIGAAATGLISVTLLEASSSTYTRLVWEGFCTINGNNLNITADPQIQPNDKIIIKYTF